ncbi:MAG TPA: hypothetical protein VKT49_10040 [Bryobacteraceae bacterium]|nr:hypothetical protein [Bryobacteraceae bacterium]
MDELDFKRHLRDLAHGHHHPEEHDWAREPGLTPQIPARKKTSKQTSAKKTGQRRRVTRSRRRS